MPNPAKTLKTATALAVVVAALAVPPQLAVAEETSVVEQGKEIAFDRKKGNCLACHAIEGGELPGNIGPPLIAMQQRFPEKSKLRQQIWDSTKANANSIMPPFGRHEILTEKEIDKIVEFVYTL